jgi:hypothetical protein
VRRVSCRNCLAWIAGRSLVRKARPECLRVVFLWVDLSVDMSYFLLKSGCHFVRSILRNEPACCCF